jgi:hypothetical protein
MAGTSNPSQNQPQRGNQASQSRGTFSDQVQNAARGAADTASELWDDAYEQGQRYYRQGGQLIGNADAAQVTGWLAAGAIGFGIAWLVFGQRSLWTGDAPGRMNQERGRRDEHRMRTR